MTDQTSAHGDTPQPRRLVDRAREALIAELGDEHGCLTEQEPFGMIACGRCAERAVSLVARLVHEKIIVERGDLL